MAFCSWLRFNFVYNFKGEQDFSGQNKFLVKIRDGIRRSKFEFYFSFSLLICSYWLLLVVIDCYWLGD